LATKQKHGITSSTSTMMQLYHRTVMILSASHIHETVFSTTKKKPKQDVEKEQGEDQRE
jgi:hypothetical protein